MELLLVVRECFIQFRSSPVIAWKQVKMSRPQRKRGRSNGRSEHNQAMTSFDQTEKARHPPHLRGKHIGMWYAKINKTRKPDTAIKSLGALHIPSSQAEQILKMLKKLPLMEDASIAGNKYESIPKSRFKDMYLNVRNSSIEQRLQDYDDIVQNETMDAQLLQEHRAMLCRPGYIRMMRTRERLPVYKMREVLINAIERNQVTIISGETGSGKTTQIPQFILDHYVENQRGSVCRILCSQPRRISTVSVAERIADERNEAIGKSVGYQIRLENRLPRMTGSILFCTTGCILKYMEDNIGLDNVSHLILDEIHERDVLSDFILAITKQIIQKRSSLKLILMSATLNAEKFARYFNVNTIITIPGFTYEVKEYFLEDVLLRTGYRFPENQPKGRRFYGTRMKDDKSKEFTEMVMPHVRRLRDLKLFPPEICRELIKEASEESVIDLALALLIDICEKEEDMGAILVFLSGYVDISKLNQCMEESRKFPSDRFLVLPLHSQMATAQQKTIFERPPRGMRKIILSTNIAETSITIDDVTFVINCGKMKLSDYEADVNGDTLKAQWISRANANQRRGRAGRVKEGVCFHLYSQVRNMLISEHHKPEILRKRLDDVILNLKLLKLGMASEFLATCPDPPNAETIITSVEFLKRLNALDDEERLTPLGYHLARLPVAPQIGKMMLLASLFSCVNPIMNIASMLDYKDAFLMPLGKEHLFKEKKRTLANELDSDHMLFHNAMQGYEHAYDKRQFCWEYFLSPITMKQLTKMKQQFADILRDLNFLRVADPNHESCNRNSQNLSLIKAVIAASLYPNVFRSKTKITRRQSIAKFHTLDGKRLEIHPKSVVCSNALHDSQFLVYYRKVRSTSDFVHDASTVHVLPLIFFGDRFKVTYENTQKCISVNDRIMFRTNDETLGILADMRTRLNMFLENKVCLPAPVNWDNYQEVAVLEAIIQLITIEYHNTGYENDEDIIYDDVPAKLKHEKEDEEYGVSSFD